MPAGMLLSAPTGDDVTSCISQIKALPYSDDPALFGLNPNASITLNRQEARNMLECILAMQPCLAATPVTAPPAPAKRPVSAVSRRPLSSRPQPPATAAAAVGHRTAATAEAVMLSHIDGMLKQLPLQLDRTDASVLHDPFAAMPGGGVNSLGMVLLQEMAR